MEGKRHLLLPASFSCCAHSHPPQAHPLPTSLVLPPPEEPGPVGLSQSLEPTHSEVVVPFPALVKLRSVGRCPGNTSTEQAATGCQPLCPLLPSALCKPWPGGLCAGHPCSQPHPPSSCPRTARPQDPAQPAGGWGSRGQTPWVAAGESSPD